MNASLWQLAGWTMIHSLWLGAAIALAGGFLRLAARRATPNTRYAISLATLTALAISPFAAAAWLSVNGVPQLAPVALNTILPPPPGGEGWGGGPTVVSGPQFASSTGSAQDALQPAYPLLHPSLTLPIEGREPDDARTNGLVPLVIDLAHSDPSPRYSGERLGEGQNLATAMPFAVADAFPNATVEHPSPTPSLPGRGTSLPASHQSPITSHLSHLAPLIPYLPILWLVGAPLTFTLLAAGLVGSERLRRRATPLVAGAAFDACQRMRTALSITRRVALAACDGVAQPVLVGVFRPLILLPTAALAGWTPEQLDMILLHELAHVRRWDNLVNLLQRIVESLLFYHPAVWILSRQVRHDREECCDATVIRHTDRPHQYAELLVSIAAALRGGPAPSLAVASAMASHPLAGRIRRILNIEAEPMRITRRTLAATLLLPAILAGAILYSGANAEDASTSPPSKEQPSTLASDERAQDDSSSEANAEVLAALESAAPSNENQPGDESQESSPRANDHESDELSRALAHLEKSKQALLAAQAELTAAERTVPLAKDELIKKHVEFTWEESQERQTLLEQDAAIRELLRKRTASGVSSEDAAVRQLKTSLAELKQQADELRDAMEAEISKQFATNNLSMLSNLQKDVQNKDQKRIGRKIVNAQTAFRTAITRLNQLSIPDAQGASSSNQGAASSPTDNSSSGFVPPFQEPKILAGPVVEIPFPEDFPDSEQERERIRKSLEANGQTTLVKRVVDGQSLFYLQVDIQTTSGVQPVWETRSNGEKTLQLWNAPTSPNQDGAGTRSSANDAPPNPTDEDSTIVTYEFARFPQNVDMRRWMEIIASDRRFEAQWRSPGNALVLAGPKSGHAQLQALLDAARQANAAAPNQPPQPPAFKPILTHNLSDKDSAPLIGGYGILQEFPANAPPSAVDALVNRLKADNRRFSVEQSEDGRRRIVDQTPPREMEVLREIRRLESLVEKAEDEITNLEVVKELATQSAVSPALTEKAVAMELDSNRELGVLNDRILNLDSAIASGNHDAAEIDDFKTLRKKTEEELKTRREVVEKTIREELTEKQNEDLRPTLLEYDIRREATDKKLAKYQQELGAARQKLSQLAVPAAQPAPLLDRLEQLRLAFDQQRSLFVAKPGEQLQKVRYEGANLPDIVGDHWPYLVKGIANKPGEPSISWGWTGLGNKNYELEAPAAAHEKFLRPLFAGTLPQPTNSEVGAASPNQGAAATAHAPASPALFPINSAFSNGWNTPPQTGSTSAGKTKSFHIPFPAGFPNSERERERVRQSIGDASVNASLTTLHLAQPNTDGKTNISTMPGLLVTIPADWQAKPVWETNADGEQTLRIINEAESPQARPAGGPGSPNQGDEATSSPAKDNQPTADRASSKKPTALDEATLKRAFESRPDNPTLTVNYSLDQLPPEQYEDQWSHMFDGMKLDPYGPKLAFEHETAADKQHMKITAPAQAHREFFETFFSGELLKAELAAPKQKSPGPIKQILVDFLPELSQEDHQRILQEIKATGLSAMITTRKPQTKSSAAVKTPTESVPCLSVLVPKTWQAKPVWETNADGEMTLRIINEAESPQAQPAGALSAWNNDAPPPNWSASQTPGASPPPEALFANAAGSTSPNQSAAAPTQKSLSPADLKARLAELFPEAVARSRKSGKPMLVHALARNSAPSRRFESETLADPNVADFTSQHFEIVTIYADEQPAFAEALKIDRVPANLVAGAQRSLRLVPADAPSRYLMQLQTCHRDATTPPASPAAAPNPALQPLLTPEDVLKKELADTRQRLESRLAELKEHGVSESFDREAEAKIADGLEQKVQEWKALDDARSKERGANNPNTLAPGAPTGAPAEVAQAAAASIAPQPMYSYPAGAYPVIEEFAADVDAKEVKAAVDKLEAAGRQVAVERNMDGRKRIVDIASGPKASPPATPNQNATPPNAAAPNPARQPLLTPEDDLKNALTDVRQRLVDRLAELKAQSADDRKRIRAGEVPESRADNELSDALQQKVEAWAAMNDARLKAEDGPAPSSPVADAVSKSYPIDKVRPINAEKFSQALGSSALVIWDMRQRMLTVNAPEQVHARIAELLKIDGKPAPPRSDKWLGGKIRTTLSADRNPEALQRAFQRYERNGADVVGIPHDDGSMSIVDATPEYTASRRALLGGMTGPASAPTGAVAPATDVQIQQPQPTAAVRELESRILKEKTALAELNFFHELSRTNDFSPESIGKAVDAAVNTHPAIETFQSQLKKLEAAIKDLSTSGKPAPAELNTLEMQRNEVTRALSSYRDNVVKDIRLAYEQLPKENVPAAIAEKNLQRSQALIRLAAYQRDLALAIERDDESTPVPASPSSDAQPSYGFAGPVQAPEPTSTSEIVIRFVAPFPDSAEERERIRKSLIADGFTATAAMIVENGERLHALRVAVPADWEAKPVWETLADGKKTLRIVNDRESASAKLVQPTSPFPTLEHQKLADRAYNLLGLELELLAPHDLERVKKLGYEGGLRIVSTTGDRSEKFMPDDILVGLHAWPVTDFQSLDVVFNRDDLADLNPLKYYVARNKDHGGPFGSAAPIEDRIVTGRLQMNPNVLSEHYRERASRKQSIGNSGGLGSSNQGGAATRSSKNDAPPAAATLKPGDAVILKVAGAFPEQPINGLYRVEPEGTLPLGPTYGRVAVAGKTALEAEAAVQAHLGTILSEAKTQLTIGESPQPTSSSEPTFLYDGKTFEQWRDLWKLELNPKRRVEAIKALTAFNRAGRGQEAADAVFEVASQYDYSKNYSNEDDEVKFTVIKLCTEGGDQIATTDWIPALDKVLKKDPKQNKALAIWLLQRMQDTSDEAKAALQTLAANDDPEIRAAAEEARAWPEKLLEKLMKADADGDQQLSNQEVVKAKTINVTYFQSLDKNEDGQLSVEELREAIPSPLDRHGRGGVMGGVMGGAGGGFF